MPANIHDLVRLPDGRAGYVRIKIGELIGVSPDLSMVFVKPEDVQVVVPATRTLEDLATGGYLADTNEQDMHKQATIDRLLIAEWEKNYG